MVDPLPDDAEAAVEELLLDDVTTNLFLLGMLDRWPAGTWYGLGDDRLDAVALVLPGLMVPYAREGVDIEPLIASVCAHRPDTVVGPRALCDQLISGWPAPLATHDQRLYVLQRSEAACEGLRQAVAEDQEDVSAMSLAMEAEDLGRPPRSLEIHEARVADRIRDGRVWVVERAGELVFTVNVGTDTVHGAQLGGTYVPPLHRGRGLASRAMAAVAARLLQERPRVTLHVREANAPAVRAYERAGFEPSTAYRVALFRE